MLSDAAANKKKGRRGVKLSTAGSNSLKLAAFNGGKDRSLQMLLSSKSLQITGLR